MWDQSVINVRLGLGIAGAVLSAGLGCLAVLSPSKWDIKNIKRDGIATISGIVLSFFVGAGALVVDAIERGEASRADEVRTLKLLSSISRSLSPLQHVSVDFETLIKTKGDFKGIVDEVNRDNSGMDMLGDQSIIIDLARTPIPARKFLAHDGASDLTIALGGMMGAKSKEKPQYRADVFAGVVRYNASFADVENDLNESGGSGRIVSIEDIPCSQMFVTTAILPSLDDDAHFNASPQLVSFSMRVANRETWYFDPDKMTKISEGPISATYEYMIPATLPGANGPKECPKVPR